MSRRLGNIFQEDIESSCKDQKVFFHNNRDIFIPPDVRMRVKLPKQKYDTFMYRDGLLCPIELKTTQGKSAGYSGSSPLIKEHQMKFLDHASRYEGVTPGIIINFREVDNRTFFIHIKDFLRYKYIAENKLEHSYKSKTNEKSIPFKICEEIGIEIKAIRKRTRHRYYIGNLFDELINKYE